MINLVALLLSVIVLLLAAILKELKKLNSNEPEGGAE